jgi:hypothetical protein
VGTALRAFAHPTVQLQIGLPGPLNNVILGLNAV